MNLVLPLLVTACALILLGYILGTFVLALLGSPRSLLQRWRFRRAGQTARVIEAAIHNSGRIDARMWKQAFFPGSRTIDARLIENVRRHNMSLLSLLVLHCDAGGRRLSNLTALEDLFAARAHLLSLWANVAAASRKVKHGDSRKEWAKKEYAEKLSAVDGELTVNAAKLKGEIERAVAELAQNQEVIYH